jgi:hypothetical protein
MQLFIVKNQSKFFLLGLLYSKSTRITTVKITEFYGISCGSQGTGNREQGTEVKIDAFSISICYFFTFAGGLWDSGYEKISLTLGTTSS